MLNWRLRAGCLGALPAGKRRAITGRRSAGWSDEASGSLKLDMAQGGWEWEWGEGFIYRASAAPPGGLCTVSLCVIRRFSRGLESGVEHFCRGVLSLVCRVV